MTSEGGQVGGERLAWGIGMASRLAAGGSARTGGIAGVRVRQGFARSLAVALVRTHTERRRRGPGRHCSQCSGLPPVAPITSPLMYCEASVARKT
jgi:hypothetical protein